MTAAIRGSFSTIHKLFRSRPDMLAMTPREIIPLANAAVFESGRSGINMTFFIGILDFDKMEMVYANAAHCPPWFIAPESGKPTKARMLMSAGPRLGETPEIEHIEEHTVALKSGDTIVFYTDGLLEGKNPEGAMYGKKRSRKVVETNYTRGEEQLVAAIVKDFLDFNGPKPLDDDLTLVAARIL
jgi:sigma-B regulation protein RsbU (phosphoserine phosphatase)